jgi:hypothetical protein
MKPLPVLAMLRFLLLATTLQGSTTRAEKHMSRVTYAVMLAAFVTNHTYTVPSAGAGAVNVTWQY